MGPEHLQPLLYAARGECPIKFQVNPKYDVHAYYNIRFDVTSHRIPGNTGLGSVFSEQQLFTQNPHLGDDCFEAICN